MTARDRAAAANCPLHTGTTQAIRDALERSPEPLSSYALFLATGIKPDAIRRAISGMVSVTGTVVSIRGPHGVTYTLYSRAVQQSERTESSPGVMPARREPFEFRELKRDPFAAMNLAMMARR